MTGDEELPPSQFGLLRHPNPAGKWQSCVRLLDPFQGDTLDKFEFDENEAAVSLGIMSFNVTGGAVYAIVGTVKGLVPSTRSFSEAFLRTYKFSEDGLRLEFLHLVKKKKKKRN